MNARALVFGLVAAPVVAALPGLQAPAPRDGPAKGAFGLSLIATPDGAVVPIEAFAVVDDCSLCHPRQAEELVGSMHSVSHHDPLYRAFAELAREEAGPEVYALCAGCHSPAGVVSGLIPRTAEEDLPEAATAGVNCDACHQIAHTTGASGPFGEPGNASFVLAPGRAKASIRAEIQSNPAHDVRRVDELERSELCAACHTVIHPTSGLRIEHTYEEWRKSVYAEKGIQCQDCHMRSVEDAVRVAKTLEPVRVVGRTSEMSSAEREIHPHWFVGGNADAEILSGSAPHARMAEERLKSAAALSISAPERARRGEELAFEAAVENVACGHSLPTSLTELRQMWVHVRVLDAGGEVLFESGALDDQGELPRESFRFGAELADAEGKPTIKPWEAASFAWKRTIAPKATERETFRFTAPTAGEKATIEARLFYRIAPPHMVRELMGEKAFTPRVVEMAAARAEVVFDEER
jgi:hypothetical protein